LRGIVVSGMFANNAIQAKFFTGSTCVPQAVDGILPGTGFQG
jgi:hypothetical protein